MSNISSKALSSFKYGYLIIFFALLSGFFHPLITNTSFDSVISGILVLFLGLAGGVLLYRSTTSQKRKEIFFGVGFTLIGISTYFIYRLIGAI
ncbi:MAG: hypothetical protein MT332_01400 [Candidatus Nitrosopumilus limneticus]|nr:conserved membrane protein of unknown function [Candidatus Nitrosopumilus limneticus]MDA0669441.1 hypothetical protein [Thermoproteota archaeon]MSS86254.1 hypothetical protein [Nitrosopumilus sp.]PHY04166.1 MAG: hypothetical protein CK526_04265 [Nitrososphaerota archaeon]MDA0853329.1 hypothetical protein [Thermoproteota archaeon]